MRISDWSSDVCSSDLEVRRKRIDEIRCFFLRRGIGSERNASGERNRAYEEVTTGKGLDRLHLKPPKLLPPHGSLPEYGGRCHSGTNCPTSRCLSRHPSGSASFAGALLPASSAPVDRKSAVVGKSV